MPEEMVGQALLFVSDKNYCTGQTIIIDGA